MADSHRSAQKEKLGVCVSSQRHLRHLIGITQAAQRAGKEVVIFLTHKGVLLTQEPEFKKIAGKARYALCYAGWKANGLEGKSVPGMNETGFATQLRHAEMMEEVDRYIVL
ncbi:MAG: hypothetical protein AB1374_13050 [Bacillota bacterium]